MYTANVIEMGADTLQNAFVFTGTDKKKVRKAAERRFVRCIKDLTDRYDKDEIKAFLEEGFCKDECGSFGIYITEPTVKNIKSIFQRRLYLSFLNV